MKVKNSPKLAIDKPIILKKQEIRRHIHRYDLRIGIKECRSEEDEQRVLQGHTIIIPPYYELDQSNVAFTDLSKTFKISDVESFTKLKRYFSRLGNRNPNTGFVYCSCIITATTPHATLMTKVNKYFKNLS
jgi:hypothetical protein